MGSFLGWLEFLDDMLDAVGAEANVDPAGADGDRGGWDGADARDAFRAAGAACRPARRRAAGERRPRGGDRARRAAVPGVGPDFAEALPKDTVILTAGCAKYRYNKLKLGDIGGIPRVLDAGQCNDSYSLAVIALKLKEVFELEDINDLPISYDIAWYEQKAVAVLLALLYLGVKKIRLGPTLPAFLSPNVAKVLVEKFDIMPIGEVEADIEAMMAGV